jgi:hypothetical protein
MTTKSLMGRQVQWWETLSSYNFNMFYYVGKMNPANEPSHCQDYVMGLEGRYTATILTAH